jgi:hypothetical protein
MVVITNRRIYDEAQGLDKFGKKPAEKILNEHGANELRLLTVAKNKNAKGYTVKLLKDKLSKAEVERLKKTYQIDIDSSVAWYSSLLVACDLMVQARRENKNILLYVHGYNNDLGDILETAERMEALYNVIVVVFSWPANGGGPVSGTAAYLSDKRDARASCDALNACIHKIDEYHRLLTEGWQKKLWKNAGRKFPNNPSAAQEYFSRMLDKDCKVSLSLVCHSMGNYLLKKAVLATGRAPATQLVFDNISLVAADANNEGHEAWVGRLKVRNRLYVVINENDFALAWSRRKPGEEQLARLGHYLKNLSACHARYIDVTHVKGVGNSHGYFQWAPDRDTEMAVLKPLFSALFEGGVVEETLHYCADIKAYRP